MRVRRSAATEETHLFNSGNLMPSARWNHNGIARTDFSFFAIEFHQTFARLDEVELFAQFVIMSLSGSACGDGRFGKALFFDRSITQIKNTPNGGTVLRGERLLFAKISDNHAEKTSHSGTESNLGDFGDRDSTLQGLAHARSI